MHIRPMTVLTTAAAGIVLASAAATAAPRPAVVTSLDFIAPTVGWIRLAPQYGTAGTLYRTIDAGRQWTVADPSIEASLVAFANPRLGTALVDQGVGACQLQFTAVTTHGGGTMWQMPQTVDASDGPNAVAFAGVTPELLNGSCAGPYATLMAGGGGKTWRSVHTFALSKAQEKRYASPAAVSLLYHGATGFAAVAYAPMSSSVPPLVLGYRTTDLGRTWQTTPLGIRGLPAQIRALSFTNAQDGLAAAVGRNGVGISLYATSNGGRSWQRTGVFPHGVSALLDLVTARVGYAAVESQGNAGSTLVVTRDGGLHWSTVTQP